MKSAGIPGIAGIDTRALVRHIRDTGAMMGILANVPNVDVTVLRARAKALPGMSGQDLIPEVTCKETHAWTAGLLNDDGTLAPPRAPPTRHVVAVDMGMKHMMPRLLVDAGCQVTIVPAHATAEEILALKPDGVLLSNGPGDPSTATGIVAMTRGLLGKVPVFGICMGHQILGQAFGAHTFKMPFGHRGGNQPVQARADGRVLITSQNHGFAVEPSQLTGGASASHTNLSDATNEGVDAANQWAFSVQYHPEAAPGPHDARVHFDTFIDLIDRWKARASA
jgi:carbamoyl-phosphate synthase small subunit